MSRENDTYEKAQAVYTAQLDDGPEAALIEAVTLVAVELAALNDTIGQGLYNLGINHDS